MLVRHIPGPEARALPYERTAGKSPIRVVLPSLLRSSRRRRGRHADVEPLESRRLLSAVGAALRDASDLTIGAGAPVATVGTTVGRSPSASGSSGLKIVLDEGPNLRANPTAAAAF